MRIYTVLYFLTICLLTNACGGGSSKKESLSKTNEALQEMSLKIADQKTNTAATASQVYVLEVRMKEVEKRNAELERAIKILKSKGRKKYKVVKNGGKESIEPIPEVAELDRKLTREETNPDMQTCCSGIFKATKGKFLCWFEIPTKVGMKNIVSIKFVRIEKYEPKKMESVISVKGRFWYQTTRWGSDIREATLRFNAGDRVCQ